MHIYIEYQAILDELQPPMTETILHCHNECETKPTCWTNYEPHYNDKYFLDELVVGTHEGWSKHSGKLTDEHAIYGYLDKKHFYQVSPTITLYFPLSLYCILVTYTLIFYLFCHLIFIIDS